jgi:cytochrome b involved in lipid metabolism
MVFLNTLKRYFLSLPTENEPMKEVAKHKTAASRIWVSYKEGVYDITDFVDAHPGQEKILLAAGSIHIHHCH